MNKPAAALPFIDPSRRVQDERNWAHEKAVERNEAREDRRSRNRYYAANFPASPLAKPR